MKKLILILLMTCSLSGCIPLAFVAGATAGGALIYDKRSFKVMLQDHNAEAQAQNNINRDPVLKGHVHISVVVFNHVALIVGQAPTPALRKRAYQWVAATKNISRIYNEVTIRKPTSKWRRADDTVITGKVKTAMLAKAGLHSTQIKVVTENAVVYLMGVVSPKQAALATNVARRVPGVKKVVKVFTYS